MDRETSLIFESYLNEVGRPDDQTRYGGPGTRRRVNLSQTDRQNRMSVSMSDDTAIKWEYIKNVNWLNDPIQLLMSMSPRKDWTFLTAFIKTIVENVLGNYKEFVQFIQTVDFDALSQDTHFSREDQHMGQVTIPDLKAEVLMIADKLGLPHNTSLLLEVMIRFGFSDINIEEYAGLNDDDPRKPYYGYESRLSKTLQSLVGATPGSYKYWMFHPADNEPAQDKPQSGPTIITPDNPAGR